ncbi:unnamed protein product [Arctia plantaginis]|uniref:Uncharacterized protein n=1 Tax=Arctia plantaginis TaxID=874455 RepID=A0A8S0ZI03_ARCPL|nr:unnamed protein product [Arctia plantaginis]
MSRLTRLIAHLKNKLKFHEQKIRRLQSINKRYRLKIHRLRKDKNNQRLNKQSKIHFPTIINEIHKFYEEDTNRRQAAGRKEFITRQGTKNTKSYWCKIKEPILGDINKVKIITTKKNEKAKPLDLIEKLRNKSNQFLKHCFTIEKQYKEMKKLKDFLRNNEAIIHMYWSENYELKYHEEVQSMHFGGSRRQVALHTSVLYLHEESTGQKITKSFCSTSANLRHDAAAVLAHLKPVLDYIYQQNIPNIKIEVVSDTFIIAKSNSLPLCLPTFKGTLDVHQVLWDIFCGQNLTFRKFSCFICEANVQCEHGAHLGFLKVPDFTHSVEVKTLADARNMSANIPIYVTVATTQDDSQNNTVFTELSNIDPVTLSTPSTSKSYKATFCDFEELVPANSLSSLEMLKENVEQLPIASTSGELLNLHVADWVLIKKTRRAIKHQVGRVIGICGDNISISVLNKVPGGFRWSKLRKREVISMNCLKAVVPEPNIDAKLNFYFQNIDFIHY